VHCHLPNPGRLKELLIPGVTVYLQPEMSKKRKTAYTVKSVQLPQFTVPLDTREVNRLFLAALGKKRIPEFTTYSYLQKEVPIADSRLDFLLYTHQQRCYVEVKSCTLVREGIAYFPDAPTTRGSRHLQALTSLKKQGHRAAIVFLIQRPDAHHFKPNTETDPQFNHNLKTAKRSGVEVYAFKLTDQNIETLVKIPISL
jgi:sugar fermentation stimulation protein A